MKPFKIFVYLNHEKIGEYDTFVLPQVGDVYTLSTFENVTVQTQIEKRLLLTNEHSMYSIIVQLKQA